MTSVITFDVYSDSSSLGMGHAENQDSYLADPENLLFAVADGVGGYKGARQASSLATTLLSKKAGKVTDEASLRSCLEDIHAEIQNKARKLRFVNMGTTIAACKILPSPNGSSGEIITANVGDSPILLFRDNDVLKLFHDDSFRSEDKLSMWSIVQYLGLDCALDVHTSTCEYKRDDILLLCSDGITDNFLSPFAVGAASLPDFARETRSARKLVERAMEIGFKPDDMTAVLVFF